MDIQTNKLRFVVDRIEENIAVCVCDTSLKNSDGTETDLIVNLSLEDVGEDFSEGDIFDAYYFDGVFSEIKMRPDIKEIRMQKNRQRLKNLFNRNKNQ